MMTFEVEGFEWRRCVADELLHRPADFGRELKRALEAVSAPRRRDPLDDDVEQEPFAFLCYSRKDGAAAKALVESLEAAGINMYWDQHFRPGDKVEVEIERALCTARATLILWSDNALASEYTAAEAAMALERGNAIPVSVEGFDAGSLPFRYRRLHCSPVTDVDRIVEALRSRGL
ncbi:MAG: toll/interleukin-1 receptor domain-containing protein [Proteobacteria bacterium]|nr:toll/interleukin-1 receptor domain-containing protein [Pseudomonadota bacterium]